MPLVKKPVAFDSINFLPGFPSLSRYQCNPWKIADSAGACADSPVNISREPNMLPASVFIQRAMLQAGVAPPAMKNMMARGIVPAALAGIVRQAHLHGSGGALLGLGHDCGCGCGGHGDCGGGLGGASGSVGVGGSAGSSYGFDGGDEGTNYGPTRLGAFDLTAITSNPVQWLQDNALPLALGAGVAWFIFRRR